MFYQYYVRGRASAGTLLRLGVGRGVVDLCKISVKVKGENRVGSEIAKKV